MAFWEERDSQGKSVRPASRSGSYGKVQPDRRADDLKRTGSLLKSKNYRGLSFSSDLTHLTQTFRKSILNPFPTFRRCLRQATPLHLEQSPPSFELNLPSQ